MHGGMGEAGRHEPSSGHGRCCGVGFREPLFLIAPASNRPVAGAILFWLPGRYPRCFRLPPNLPASSSLACPPCHGLYRTGPVGRSRSSTTATGSSPGVTAIGCVCSRGTPRTGPTRSRRLSRRCWHCCRGHRREAAGSAVSVGPVRRLAQDQEPRRRRRRPASWSGDQLEELVGGPHGPQQISIIKNSRPSCGDLLHFLGSYSVLFNGSQWAWIVVVGGILAVAVGSYSLLRSFWKTGTI